MTKKKGFTLIELLVVVLIIGILAAMAMSYYEKVVWQSRNTQLKTAAKAIADAQRMYFMKMGQIPTSFETLGVSIPLEVKATNAGTNSNVCRMTVRKGKGVLEGENFIVILNSSNETTGNSVALWTEGKYKCNGFVWRVHGISGNPVQCLEARNGTSTIKEGEFCEELETAVHAKTDSGWAKYDML